MWILWLILFALLLLCMLCFFAAEHFYRVAFIRRREKKGEEKAETPRDVKSRAWHKAGYAWLETVQKRDVTIKSKDGLRLYGLFLPNGDNKKLAIVIHGWTGRKEGMAGYARIFYEMGCAVLLPDLRAHGKSEGERVGFGWLDKDDIKGWIDYSVHQLGAEEILLHGISMGAATVMMTTGEKLPPQVRCAIADCGYASVYEEFTFAMGTFVKHCPIFFRKLIIRLTALTKKRDLGYDIMQADTKAQLRKSVTPTLFIHGDKDGFVPYYMLERVYNACTAKKDRLTIADADHCDSVWTDEARYEGAVRAFAQKYM